MASHSFILLLLLTATTLALDSTPVQPSAIHQWTTGDATALNPNYTITLQQARQLLISFDAGAGYPQVWIRDFNTFIDVAMTSAPIDKVRHALLMFLFLQQPDGDIIDGYMEATNQTFKNTVETDQETSFVQALAKFIRFTGEHELLALDVNGVTVMDRVEQALDYLLKFRFSAQHQLLFGGTTIDWGDVQPEDTPGIVFDNKTHPAIDIYDNAMFVMALQDWHDLIVHVRPLRAQYWHSVMAHWVLRIREELWDEQLQQFRQHIYLEKGSPFPSTFDESGIYYHGGTMVAAQAGLLSRQEIQSAFQRMQQNVVKSGGKMTIGLSVYPPYPNGYWANSCCNVGYSYQNAGDWGWFTGRFVQALIREGLLQDAQQVLDQLTARVVQHGFWEWYDYNNQPRGSAQYRGEAGVIGKAIEMFQQATQVPL